MSGVADTTMTIYGSGHLAGQTAWLSICGIYAGQAVVAADGSVTFTFGSDPGGILTVPYIIANQSEGTDHDVTFAVFDGNVVETVTIPILVGVPYTAQGQVVYPLKPEELGVPGMGLGKTRRASWGAFLVRDLLALAVGTDFTRMDNLVLSTDGLGTPELAIAADAPYTGMIMALLDDQSGLDSRIAWEVQLPYNVIIGGVGSFIQGADR